MGSVQKFGKTWKVGHRIYSFFFPTLATNNGTLQKKEHAEELLTILFDKTPHNGYFGKLPIGSKDKFAKMTNTTLPLFVLMWLRQLEEYFYKIGDTNESRDWNAHVKYCPVKARNIHMIKANSTAVTKITSVQWIKPDIKNNKKVVKYLEEWAAKILCRDNNYVKNKANRDDKTKKRFDRTKNMGKINMLCQKDPTNQSIRRQETTLILSTSPHNNNDKKLQTNYFCVSVIS